ncbi:MAG: extracellular solute-binding protein [Oscillospiraceae bacterium]|nr:extracellular solute-binding protein [Oscillospiraceae bacterium]
MKRILTMLLLAVLVFSLFTACGEEKKPASTATAPANGVYTITLAHDLQGEPLEVLNTYLALFSKTFPHIAVELVAADTENPNVLYCMPDRAAELAAQDKLVDMAELVDCEIMMSTADGSLAPLYIEQETLNDIFEFYYKEGFVGKALYSMPLSKSSQIIYFNQTFFEENNLDFPLTWEDVELLLAQLKELDPDCIPLCIEDPADFFITMCAQNDADYTTAKGDIKFDNKKNREYMEKLNDWYQKGYITTRTIMGREEAGALLATDVRHYMAFGSTHYATSQQLTENNESFAFELGMFPFPQQGYENQKTLARGPGLSVFKNDDEEVQLASWMLVRFLTLNTQFQSKFAQAAGMLPVLTSAELEDSYSTYLDKANGADNVAAMAALSSMEQQHALFTTPIFDGSAEAYTQVGLLLDKCLTATGEKVDEQIKDAFKEAEKACK